MIFELRRIDRLGYWALAQEQVVKCLIYYHPDDLPDRRHSAESQVRTLCEATNETGHELLLELIPVEACRFKATPSSVP